MTNLIIKKNIFFLLVFAAFLLLLFTGCASGTPKIDGTAFEEKSYSDPQESALLFGFISKVNTGLSSKDLPVDKIELVQINPDIPPMFITPGTAKNDPSMNYTQPVPVGSVFKIASWNDEIGQIRYNYFSDSGFGLSGEFITLYDRIYPPFDQLIIINASSPGLCYYGSYILDKDREKFSVDKKKTELDALKILIKKYKSTPWENTIAERIKELEK